MSAQEQRLEMDASPVPGDYVATLSVYEAVSQSAGRFLTGRKPREVGCFSIVGEQPCWVDGAAMLKYLRMPSSPDQLCWDLNMGYETAVRWDLLKGKKIHNLLRWLAYQASNPAAEPWQQSLLANTDFACGRGTLARIACTPYDKSNDWRLVACRHRGTIFLCSSLTDAYRQLRLDDKADPERDRPAYWGYKFEQFMAASEPGGEPNVQAMVNEREACHIVVRSRLASHSLLVAAQVDCADHPVLERCKQNKRTDGSSSPAGYIELKTSQLCLERQAHNFHRIPVAKTPRR
ncbi:hypothetical protein HPB48_016622 [Haemaphysalis longicornis]|uniref:Decapping nuclease n=1 Tax=Haemaphysalis longicornis TaxID=44386 RepID=A0A9J6H4P1_HAELO|nr:hypothetical protein HPB48_016622 [Haemaphysalis longicornis]